MRRKFTVVGLGEALWDLLPGGKQLGGAPTNFACISTLLGDRGVVASRVATQEGETPVIAKKKLRGRLAELK